MPLNVCAFQNKRNEVPLKLFFFSLKKSQFVLKDANYSMDISMVFRMLLIA